MGVKFKQKIVLQSIRKGFSEHGFATGIWCWVYQVLGESKYPCLSGLMVSKAQFRSSDPRLFPGGQTYQFWYCKSSVKKQWGRDRRPISVICVVRSVIFVGGWVVMAWNWKSCLGPVEISPNVFLVQFKEGGRRVSPAFHLFVADANEGNKDLGWVHDQGWEWLWNSKTKLCCKASGMWNVSSENI